MRLLVIMSLFALSLVAARPDASKYPSRYDTVDLDMIVNNKKVLESYLKCVLDEGKCTPEGKELKAHIKEALETYCAKCTEPQKEGTRFVIGHLVKNEKEWWRKLSDKYDPERKYVTKYEAELKSIS
ncbi:allergen Tha p 1 [Manduca sexta]|uniref:Uncharacterized protein n=1 Tax=Manduca sexta TaxID=7130 RepID=A0A921ZAU8_MANSE|nr:allergen Tha p 1 [Manduca sexta]XP_037295210.1 allergen Tha p 1 [Manduca sexta]KAG6454392.1 hypothetical protein O3G_MSEX008692 [Manduca sexta]KAG6454393.1 hypothetical protein O3G_MSEX008692 [Manduca sexta]KAG6454394.1 hypothetical protein O3G_MSEX008692 [Manduca sexta]